MNKITIAAILAAVTTGCATAPTPRTSSVSLTHKCDTIYMAMDAHHRRVDPLIASCAAGGSMCPSTADLDELNLLVPAATSCLNVGYMPSGNLKQRQRESERRAANLRRMVARLEGRS